MNEIFDLSIYENIKDILANARAKAYSAVNFAMVEAYWNIGRIIYDAQSGNERAEYGDYLVKNLSDQLTLEFGKGFDRSNLIQMRKFYMMFQKGDALRHQLSWTHYRLLIRIEKDDARNFYIEECIQNQWITRQLDRQINSFYYERLLSSQNKVMVRDEIKSLEAGIKPEDIIKDPFVLEFLNLKDNTDFREKDIEKALLLSH